jgi:hypothetical protein
LIKERRKKMLICDFLVIGLRSEVLRRWQRLLHLLRELIDAHESPLTIGWRAANAVLETALPKQSYLPIAGALFPAYESER